MTDPATPFFLSSGAKSIRWSPEWVVLGQYGLDADYLAQILPRDQWVHAFGFSFSGQYQPPRANAGYFAFKQQSPDTEPAILLLPAVFAELRMLSIGIQMAGPNLTPETFAQGLAHLPEQPRPRRHLGLPRGGLQRAPGRAHRVVRRRRASRPPMTGPAPTGTTASATARASFPTGEPPISPDGLMTGPRRAVTAARCLVLGGLWLLTVVVPGTFRAGVVAQGLLAGSASGLLALGLVLIYRTTRIVNLAYQAMGACAAQLGATTYLHFHWPWAVSIATALVAGAAAGALTDLLLRRFENAPRLVVTVATIGLLQVFTAVQVLVPYLLGANTLVVAFPTGLSDASHVIGSTPFFGDDLLALIARPARPQPG